MADSPVDLVGLRKLAEAATPGPWFTAGPPWFQDVTGVLAASPDPHAGFLIVDTEAWVSDREEYIVNGGKLKLADPEDDAAFIAAFNPTVALSLLDRVEAQTGPVELLRELTRQVRVSNAVDDNGHALANLKALADAEAFLSRHPQPASTEPKP